MAGGEIISLSFGQLSNNIITHLYNTQDSLIPYSKEQKDILLHDLSTFLTRFKDPTSNGYNYSPNCLVYDLRNGLGSLSKYEYSEPKPNLSDYTMLNGQLPPKNEFQRQLDIGVSKGNLLNVPNTANWTDFGKLIYNKRSLHTIKNYTTYLQHYNIPNLKFDTFPKGVEEFKSNDKEIDDFRFFLEKCDKFQGLQILNELDNGWNGFSNEYITMLKDEYFNNSNKLNIWNYSIITKENKNVRQKQNLIRSFVETWRSSSLFIPLNLDTHSDLLTSNFNFESNWHKSAIFAMFINSIWGINSQDKDQINMSGLQNLILSEENENRKIINDVKIKGIDIQADIVNYYDLPNYDIDLSLASGPSGFNFNQTFINQDSTLVNPDIENILQVDTFPTGILVNKKETKFNIEMNQSSSLRNWLKPYMKIIENSKENEIIDDKNELIEEICQIMNEYATTEESDEDYE
ncbi:unnamed protein product [Candida verbasci]|uniref:Protein DML1 n=1 Tax=Candida verbasci TaxID=1227364 RepID=A0A9W4TX43_9ASCO|nr:unnamed protein product [Candida verbasci]